VVTSNQLNPTAIVVDANNVYLSSQPGGSSTSIAQFAKSNGAMTILAANQPFPIGLLTDGAYVYWGDANSGQVRRAPVGTTGADVTLATPAPSCLAANATTLFWVSQSGVVQSMAKSGGTVTNVATGAPGNALACAVDASRVYFVAPGKVGAAPIAGGSVTTLATSPQPFMLAIDATNAYWLEQSGSGGSLRTVPLAGGPVVSLYAGLNSAGGLVVDSGNIYFTEGSSVARRVLRVPVAGGAPVELASGGYAYGLAVDATYVYWLSIKQQVGTVMQAPK
jgi:hypothetical protein